MKTKGIENEVFWEVRGWKKLLEDIQSDWSKRTWIIGRGTHEFHGTRTAMKCDIHSTQVVQDENYQKRKYPLGFIARQSDGIWPLHAQMNDTRAPANEFMSKYTNLGKRNWLMKVRVSKKTDICRRRKRARGAAYSGLRSQPRPTAAQGPSCALRLCEVLGRGWCKMQHVGDTAHLRPHFQVGDVRWAGTGRANVARCALRVTASVGRGGAYGGGTGVASMVSDEMWSGGGTRGGGCLSRGGDRDLLTALRRCGVRCLARGEASQGSRGTAVAGGARGVGSARQAEASRPLLVAREKAWAESYAMGDERRVLRMREVVRSERGMHMRQAPRATKTVGRCEKATEAMWAARDADVDAVHAAEGARMSCVRRRGVERVGVAQGREWMLGCGEVGAFLRRWGGRSRRVGGGVGNGLGRDHGGKMPKWKEKMTQDLMFRQKPSICVPGNGGPSACIGMAPSLAPYEVSLPARWWSGFNPQTQHGASPF
ncbi:hypothetical protein B0H14DRAFT_3140648 [Mycena olivaceomarginata]|nr:hypothetical protein B0H14DRAFT_3140648 [Mycena olivaceomarginata]